ncbi:MAG: hypothetical protein RRC34_13785 [Lentisphaeria bacterium]|nr:hypothetical protein [Lentisphaeria bacterium]
MSRKIIVLSIDRNLATQKRTVRSFLFRNFTFRMSVLSSVLGLVTFIIFQEFGFLSFHPSFLSMVLFVILWIAIMCPYSVMFSLWTKVDAGEDQKEPLKALISTNSIEILGHTFQCEIPWTHVTDAIKTQDVLLFSTQFPFSGIYFCLADLGGNEPDLYSILVEKKIRCVGKWQKPTKASPPPLPPGKSDD